MSQNRLKVITLGGGFGGLTAARSLTNKKSIEITLIDRTNNYLLHPLLYQVATAALSPGDIWIWLLLINSEID